MLRNFAKIIPTCMIYGGLNSHRLVNTLSYTSWQKYNLDKNTQNPMTRYYMQLISNMKKF